MERWAGDEAAVSALRKIAEQPSGERLGDWLSA